MSLELLTAIAAISAAAASVVIPLINRLFDKWDRKAQHAWDVEDREKRQTEVVDKIDANTKVNEEAITVANHANEKIAELTALADRNAVLSMGQVTLLLSAHGREIAAVKSTGEETRRLVQIRLGEKLHD